MQYNKERASALTPLLGHSEALDGLRYFVEEQIKDINSQLHKAPNWDTVCNLQGQYQILKQFLTIREDAQATLKGGR